MIVAIDGPAGAGKSTVARAVAAALGFRYLDTGALYRAVAVAASDEGIDPSDQDALGRIAATVALDEMGERVLVKNRDVTEQLRDPDATAHVSTVSAHPSVRSALIPVQRACGEKGDVVVEGRDIGTTVFPNADVKLFLEAAPEERAVRRARQLGRADDSGYVERVAAEIEERDRRDSSRAVSPLTKAPDAIVLDTTGMLFEEVVARVVELVRSVSTDA